MSEERLKEMLANYSEGKRQIENEARFSAEGKREALKDLATGHLAKLRELLKDLDSASEALQKEIAELKKTATAAEELTAEQLLAERREVDLLLSRLTAAGREGFIRVAEEAAIKQPGAFQIAYRQALEIAERYYPNPGADEPGSSGAFDRSNRASAFAALAGFFERAAQTTITPAEREHQERIAELEKAWAGNLTLTLRVKRAAEQLERNLAPTFEDIAADSVRK